jgi:hypothetical protein
MKTFAPLTDTRRNLGVAAVLGAMVMVAACGSQGTTGHPASAGSRPRSSLTITVAAAQGATPRRWTLTCAPAGGTHPNPQATCAALSSVNDPFAPVPPHTMCPMIASGTQTASIKGTWDGERISASYARDNGCQTARWDKLVKVLDGINPGGPMIPASGAGSSGTP